MIGPVFERAFLCPCPAGDSHCGECLGHDTCKQVQKAASTAPFRRPHQSHLGRRGGFPSGASTTWQLKKTPMCRATPKLPAKPADCSGARDGQGPLFVLPPAQPVPHLQRGKARACATAAAILRNTHFGRSTPSLAAQEATGMGSGSAAASRARSIFAASNTHWDNIGG